MGGRPPRPPASAPALRAGSGLGAIVQRAALEAAGEWQRSLASKFASVSGGGETGAHEPYEARLRGNNQWPKLKLD